MKTVKITKKMLKMHPVDLLKFLDLYNKKEGRVYPERLYMSSQDIKAIEKEVRKAVQKNMEYKNKKMVDFSTNAIMLNYSPNSSLEHAIKSGYAIVED